MCSSDLALVGGLLIIWMKELLSVWISPHYAEGNSIFFCIIILAYGILSLSRPAHQTLVGLGKVKFTSLAYLTSSLLMLAAVYLLSGQFGLVGAGAANLVMVLLLSMNIFLYIWFNRKQVWGRFLPDLLIGVLPMVVSLVIVVTGINWPYKLIYSVVLLTVILYLLFRNPDFIIQLKHLFNRQLTLPERQG